MKRYIAIFALSFFWCTQTMRIYQSFLSIVYGLQKTGSHTKDLCNLKKEYQQFEDKHNKKVAQLLKNTDYHKITPLCHYLLKNNYYIREKYAPDKNFYTLKEMADLVTFSNHHFEKRKKEVDLFDTLIEMQCDILDTTHKQVYNESYYKQKEALQNQILALKKSTPKVCSNNVAQKNMRTEL